ncbi:hypothetical protein FJD35_23420 [Pseudomonas mandelii]|nr:hypothetical protein [Pseudomonas mandelii]TWS08118.1 hypothetical protein FJD35_23420 [Pseudomonas mandelii]
MALGRLAGFCAWWAFVARELAPARRRSLAKPANTVFLMYRVWRAWGRFAAQREQAPSPQQLPGHKDCDQ